ncbi:MAG: hypothetical protein ABI699_19240 [Caldimonas sp.]
MGLLATLGLTPTVSMLQVGAMTRASASPARAGELAAAPTQPNPWAVDPAQPTSHEAATPYGTFYIDWQNRDEVMPWVEDALAAFAKAKAAHSGMLEAAARLAKAKRIVEAQPHSAAEITADVTKQSKEKATDSAEGAETSKNLTTLVLNEVRASKRDLVEIQKEWVVAASQLEGAGERQEAAELRAAVAAQKEEIDGAVKMFTDLLEVSMKAASGAGAVEYLGMAVGKVVECVHLINGRERLMRADALEKKAQTAAMADLASIVQNVSSRHAACADALTTLQAELIAFREDQVRQRDRAALDFDHGSKGKFRMKELVKAMKAAEALKPKAEAALRAATAAAHTGGALSRATPRDTARRDDDLLVIDRMLKEARQWKESAEKLVGRSERLLLLWSALCDAALAAMVESTGRGKSIADEYALD